MAFWWKRKQDNKKSGDKEPRSKGEGPPKVASKPSSKPKRKASPSMASSADKASSAGKAIPLEVKVLCMEAIDAGLTPKEVAKIANVSTSSLANWRTQWRKAGASGLAQLALASSRHLSALGPAPASVRDAGHSRESRGRGERVGSRLCVDGPRGMSLHAATAVKARQRSALERLLCYVLRPPVVSARVRWRDDGMVELSLSRAWSNGTRCFLFTPLAFIGRLVPLIPAPGTHDIRYHGVFAPNARWRREVVAMAPGPSVLASDADRSPYRAGCKRTLGIVSRVESPVTLSGAVSAQLYLGPP